MGLRRISSALCQPIGANDNMEWEGVYSLGWAPRKNSRRSVLRLDFHGAAGEIDQEQVRREKIGAEQSNRFVASRHPIVSNENANPTLLIEPDDRCTNFIDLDCPTIAELDFRRS